MDAFRKLLRAGLALTALASATSLGAQETWTQTQLAMLERSVAPGRLTELQREMARPIFSSVHEYLAIHDDRTFPLWIRTARGRGNTFLIDEIAKVLWNHKHREHLNSDYFEKPWLRRLPKNMGSVLILDHLVTRYGRHTRLAELESILTELFDFDHYGVVVLLDDENSFEKLSANFRKHLTVVDLLPVIARCDDRLATDSP